MVKKNPVPGNVADIVLSSIEEGIALLNKNGEVVLTNRSWNKISKSISNSLFFIGSIGYNYFLEFKKNNETDSLNCLIEKGFLRVLRGKEKSFSFEFEGKCDEDIKSYFIRVNNYGNNDGLVLTLNDITERKINEKEIQMNKKRMDDLINNVSDAIFSIDSENLILTWSKSCELLYGYNESEAIGKNLDDLLQTELLLSSTSIIYAQLTENGLWSGEIIQKNKLGDSLLFMASYKKQFVKKSKSDVIVINKNITEIRKNEIKLGNALIMGQENERARIASNLHDGLGQYLSGLRMHIQALKTSVESSSYEKLISIIDSCIFEYRAVSHNLLPPNLKEDGIIKALNQIFKKTKSDVVTISLYSDQENIKLNQETEIELFRIIQELVNNALKHGQADNIEVKFSNTIRGVLNVDVIDNGKGFDVKSTLKKGNGGMGLPNIISRIYLIKGHIDITSNLGQGSHIKISIKK